MAVATVTSKGQVTVPAEVRRELRIEPGDKLVFTRDGEGMRVLVVPARKASEMFGAVATDRPYPGKAKVRAEAAAALAQRRRTS